MNGIISIGKRIKTTHNLSKIHKNIFVKSNHLQKKNSEIWLSIFDKYISLPYYWDEHNRMVSLVLWPWLNKEKTGNEKKGFFNCCFHFYLYLNCIYTGSRGYQVLLLWLSAYFTTFQITDLLTAVVCNFTIFHHNAIFIPLCLPLTVMCMAI